MPDRLLRRYLCDLFSHNNISRGGFVFFQRGGLIKNNSLKG